MEGTPIAGTKSKSNKALKQERLMQQQFSHRLLLYRRILFDEVELYLSLLMNIFQSYHCRENTTNIYYCRLSQLRRKFQAFGLFSHQFQIEISKLIWIIQRLLQLSQLLLRHSNHPDIHRLLIILCRIFALIPFNHFTKTSIIENNPMEEDIFDYYSQIQNQLLVISRSSIGNVRVASINAFSDLIHSVPIQMIEHYESQNIHVDILAILIHFCREDPKLSVRFEAHYSLTKYLGDYYIPSIFNSIPTNWEDLLKILSLYENTWTNDSEKLHTVVLKGFSLCNLLIHRSLQSHQKNCDHSDSLIQSLTVLAEKIQEKIISSTLSFQSNLDKVDGHNKILQYLKL
jgi:hypothetical protein